MLTSQGPGRNVPSAQTCGREAPRGAVGVPGQPGAQGQTGALEERLGERAAGTPGVREAAVGMAQAQHSWTWERPALRG